ncbi:MAG: SPFH domain-containing protein [Candidatus Hodarchaeota archaeon]
MQLFLDPLFIISIVVVLVVVGYFASGLYVVQEWQRGVVFRLGRIVRVSDGGLHFRIPGFDSVRRVDMRTQTIDLKGQSAITKDNISVGIDAVVFMKIEDAKKLILRIFNYRNAVAKYAQTSIRDITGQYNLDDLLENREEVAINLKEEIDKLTKEWGIDIPKVGLQDITLPTDMKRAFAVQAEAERESRAVVVKAKAEMEASEKLKLAAENFKDPNAMQLRILSTLNDISKDQSNTIIIALPLETLKTAGIQGVAALASVKAKYEQAD